MCHSHLGNNARFSFYILERMYHTTVLHTLFYICIFHLHYYNRYQNVRMESIGKLQWKVNKVK